MRHEADWYQYPRNVPYPLGHAGGVWDYHGVRYVHRTLIPALSPEQQAYVGGPMAAELIPDVDPANLRNYQQAGAKFSRERDGSVLAWEMGCGKTRTALYATHRPDPFGIIVAPKVTWGVWEKEIKLVHGPDVVIHRVRGRAAESEERALWKPGIYIINPEIVWARRVEWFGTHPDFLIADEAHLYTRGSTERTKGIVDLALLARQRIALTGTPILRHTMDLHGILKVVAPSAFGSWGDMAKWLGFRRGPHGWDLAAMTADARALLEQRLGPVVDWKRWTEVSDSVPPLQRERLPVALEGDDLYEYERLASDVRECLGDAVSLSGLAQAAGLVQVGVLRRFVGKAKVPAVADLVLAAGEPCVVWAWHRDVVAAIVERLKKAGCSVSVVTGAEPDWKRAKAIEDFQNGVTDHFVATIAAGGVGIDLTRSRISIMAELSWLPGEVAQAESRVYRTGQTRACLTFWPLVAGTIEERIVDILIAKAEHARSDIFPEGLVKPTEQQAAEEMVSLLAHAMEEGMEGD